MISRKLFSVENELADLLVEGRLASADRISFFDRMMRGRFPESQNKAALVLLAKQTESIEDLSAAWKAIRLAEKTVVKFNLPCLDTCGTGGDGSHSINLSTLSSVVMAAAGVRVLKHGNRAITSRCGSSDLLSAFGYNLEQSSAGVMRSVKKLNLGYFHAPAVHPVYARFQSLRRQLHTRTLFNLLGPVLNPVAVSYQLLGASEDRLIGLYAKLLPRLGRKRALVFQGVEGMDEITSLGPASGLLLQGDKSKEWRLNPSALGFRKGRKSELQIHSVEHAKKRALDILKNKKVGTARDSVLLSAAVGIFVAEEGCGIADASRRAEAALDSGKAWNVLNALVRNSKI